MRRGKITSGSASTSASGSCRRSRQRMLLRAAPAPAAPRDTRSRSRPGGAKPGECSIRPASISPRAKASQLHVAGGLDQFQRAPRGHCTRNSRTQRRQRARSRWSRRRPAARGPPRPPPRRARAPAAPARAPAVRAPRAAAPRRPASARRGAGCGRTARTPSVFSSCAMACVTRRLRHVQARGGAAEVQFFGHGDELAPGAQVDQASFICQAY